MRGARQLFQPAAAAAGRAPWSYARCALGRGPTPCCAASVAALPCASDWSTFTRLGLGFSETVSEDSLARRARRACHPSYPNCKNAISGMASSTRSGRYCVAGVEKCVSAVVRKPDVLEAGALSSSVRALAACSDAQSTSASDNDIMAARGRRGGADTEKGAMR